MVDLLEAPQTTNGHHLDEQRLIFHDWQELARNATEPTWVVDRLLVESGLTVCAGDPKSGRKSWLVLECLKRVSLGQDFLGRGTYKRTCVYSSLEEDGNQIGWRGKKLGVLNMPGLDDLGSVRISFGLDQHDLILAEMEAGRMRGHLWVIDTLSRVTARDGVDENDASEMTRFLDRYSHAARTSRSAILVTHHFRKSGDTMRGSTAIEAVVDGWWYMRQADDPDVRRMECTLRYAAPCEIFVGFGMSPNGVMAIEVVDAPAGEGEDGGSRRKSKKSKGRVSEQLLYVEVRRLFAAAPTTKRTLESVRRAAQDRYENATQNAVRRVLKQLVDEGLVRAEEGAGGGYAATQKLSRGGPGEEG